VTTAVGALPDLVFDPILGRVVTENSDDAFAGALAEAGIGVYRTSSSAHARREAFDRRYDRAAIVGRYVDLLGGPSKVGGGVKS